MREWNETQVSNPDPGVIVETKIDDAQGIRNEQPLKLGRVGGLWFLPDGSMYVYYTPTHWRYADATTQGSEGR